MGAARGIRSTCWKVLLGAGLILALPGAVRAAEEPLEITAPRVILKGIPFTVAVTPPEGAPQGPARVLAASGEELGRAVPGDDGPISIEKLVVTDASQLPLTIEAGGESRSLERHLLPGWVTIAPPLVAIILALLIREVVTSLFVGVWLGAFLLQGYNPLTALLRTVDELMLGSLTDSSRGSILIFSLLLGGMVGVLNKMGASTAIVQAVIPVATSRRRGQLATWAAGLLIFFDDYANTLIIGNTMRPLTDKLRISREKLAYIVDSTAAPVAALVFVSTWVGYEVGLIDAGLKQASQQTGAVLEMSAFSVFLSSIPYLFYPLFALFFILALVLLKRDFGPMLAAEKRAVSGGGVYNPDSTPAGEVDAEAIEGREGARWWMAALPVVVVVATVLTGLIHTGLSSIGDDQPRTLQNIFGNADPYAPLLWGTLLGCLTAMSLAVGAKLMSLHDVMKAWVGGLKAMLMAVIILLLAWSLGSVTQFLGTAPYLTSVLSDAMPPALLPAAVFVVAGLISFATGTSWATMAILYPLVIPLSISMGAADDPSMPEGFHLLLGSIAGVMAGSLFGDHCSPISDTTVLSSMASGCDHLDHVKTQLPYAVTTAAVALVFGALPAGLDISPWLSLIAGAVVLLVIIRVLGKPVEEG